MVEDENLTPEDFKSVRINLPEVLQTFSQGDSNVFTIINLDNLEQRRRHVTFRKTRATINGEDVIIITVRDVSDSVKI